MSKWSGIRGWVYLRTRVERLAHFIQERKKKGKRKISKIIPNDFLLYPIIDALCIHHHRGFLQMMQEDAETHRKIVSEERDS